LLQKAVEIDPKFALAYKYPFIGLAKIPAVRKTKKNIFRKPRTFLNGLSERERDELNILIMGVTRKIWRGKRGH